MPEDRATTIGRFPDNDLEEIGAGDVRAFVNTSFDLTDALKASGDSLVSQVAAIAAGFQIDGVVANAAALPADPPDGYAYITEDDGSTHIYHAGTGWTQMSSGLETRMAAGEVALAANGAKIVELERWRVDIGDVESFGDAPISVGMLREMTIGEGKLIPVAHREATPGSGVMLDISKLELLGVIDRGHPVVNALVIRTGVQTWELWAEEWTGTTHQPNVQWLADIDPAWPNAQAVGGAPGTSFTSLGMDLRTEIGDATVFGSLTLVAKMQELELSHDTLSRRIASLEGGNSAHVDIVADLRIHIEAQGEHYLILLDDTGAPDHVGINLLDGAEHKVDLAWKAGFDPNNVEGTDWDVSAPSVWFQSGSVFKRMVDPATGSVLTYTAVKAFIVGGSVLTIKWNTSPEQMEVVKVEHGTVHS